VEKKSTSARIFQTVRPTVSNDDNSTPNQSFSRSKTPRQRAATLGERTRPNGSDVRSRWGISPTQDPSAKMYSVESKMTISQILDSLRVCFNNLELEFSEKKQKNSVKVKGRLSDGNRKKTQVIVELKPLDDGNIVVNFKPTTKKRTSSKKKDTKPIESFPEVCKKIEENLIV